MDISNTYNLNSFDGGSHICDTSLTNYENSNANCNFLNESYYAELRRSTGMNESDGRLKF